MRRTEKFGEDQDYLIEGIARISALTEGGMRYGGYD